MRISSLLARWSEALIRTQAAGTGDPKLDGALICPACRSIHGRCADAMYPFLYMAEATGESRWSDAAASLFAWMENNVSLPSGGFINDVGSDWKGITVFTVIMLLDCLERHPDAMGPSLKVAAEKRLGRAADFLLSFDLMDKNTNYPVSAALALYRSGRYFSDGRYMAKAMEYKKVIEAVFTPDYLIFGESTPRDGLSPKGLHSIDIGYNVEETLPSIASLALLSGDDHLLDLAVSGFRSHLRFMLHDGAWDNSAGTRNFKWTYWGSRTSDGAAAALLSLRGFDGTFQDTAFRNLSLMERCTSSSGLLMGGPGYEDAGEPICIHHTFTHAKVLASILDDGLADEIPDCSAAPYTEGIGYVSDMDSWIVSKPSYRAVVTGYDWPFMKGGHLSGGTLSMLHHAVLGPIVAAGPTEYIMREPLNMQEVRGTAALGCPVPRIEYADSGIIYSSMYDVSASLSSVDGIIRAIGILRDRDGRALGNGEYRIIYHFLDDVVRIEASFQRGCFILPVISGARPSLSVDGSNILIQRTDGAIQVCAERGMLRKLSPEDAIFSFSPGFSMLPIALDADSGTIDISIRFSD